MDRYGVILRSEMRYVGGEKLCWVECRAVWMRGLGSIMLEERCQECGIVVR